MLAGNRFEPPRKLLPQPREGGCAGRSVPQRSGKQSGQYQLAERTLAGSGAQRAVFQGTGGLLLITVSGSNSATLTRAGGGAPAMTATLTRAMTTSGGGIILLGSSATLLPSGVQTYYVGGTLSVPANQPAGDYSGTFTLTVNYL